MADEIHPEDMSPEELAAEGGGLFGTPWDRRTFLKGAALGTAAAAMYQGGSLFAPLAAYANDLSTYPCTAQDVTVGGNAIVINEPCDLDTDCSGGTFDAIVRFAVSNHTSTGRYCITLHLPGSTDGSVTAHDVILHVNSDATGSSSIPGNTTQFMYGKITGFPCSAGRVCFGTEGTVRGKCSAPGACATVAWSTTPGDAGCSSPDTKPPRGQCRHQNICVVGYGASLSCPIDPTSGDQNCEAPCGSGITLTACVQANPDNADFDLSLSDGTSVVGTATLHKSDFNTDTDTACTTFDVTPTAGTTYTLTVTDKNGCQRTASASVTVAAVSATLAVAGDANNACLGVLTFSVTTDCVATPSDSNISYFLDGSTTALTSSDNVDTHEKYINVNSDGTLSFRWLDGTCHSVSASVTCDSSCPASTDAITVCQCVTSNQGCTAGDSCQPA